MDGSSSLRQSGRRLTPTAKALENASANPSTRSRTSYPLAARSTNSQSRPSTSTLPVPGPEARLKRPLSFPAASDGPAGTRAGSSTSEKRPRVVDQESAGKTAAGGSGAGTGSLGRAAIASGSNAGAVPLRHASGVTRPKDCLNPAPVALKPANPPPKPASNPPPAFMELLARVEKLEKSLARQEKARDQAESAARQAEERAAASEAREVNMLGTIDNLKKQVEQLTKAVAGSNREMKEATSAIRADIVDIRSQLEAAADSGDEADVSDAEQDKAGADRNRKPRARPSGQRNVGAAERKKKKKKNGEGVSRQAQNQLHSCARLALAKARGTDQSKMGTDQLPAWQPGALFDYSQPPSHERNKAGLKRALTYAQTNRKHWGALEDDKIFGGISKAIDSSFDTLRRRFKKQALPQDKKELHQAEHRRQERKRRKAARRVAVLLVLWASEQRAEFGLDFLDPNLFCLEEIQDLLQVELMSSEVSDGEPESANGEDEENAGSEADEGNNGGKKKKVARRTYGYRSGHFSRLLDVLDDPVVRDSDGEAVHSDDAGQRKPAKLPRLRAQPVLEIPSVASWEHLAPEVSLALLNQGVPIEKYWRAKTVAGAPDSPTDPERYGHDGLLGWLRMADVEPDARYGGGGEGAAGEGEGEERGVDGDEFEVGGEDGAQIDGAEAAGADAEQQGPAEDEWEQWLAPELRGAEVTPAVGAGDVNDDDDDDDLYSPQS